MNPLKIRSFFKNNPGLTFILLLTFFLRTVLLNQFPIGITHDELNYIIAAKSLFYTGGFAPGSAPAIFPTTMTNLNTNIPEVPGLLLAPLIGF
jgi:hypothetical protein